MTEFIGVVLLPGPLAQIDKQTGEEFVMFLSEDKIPSIRDQMEGIPITLEHGGTRIQNKLIGVVNNSFINTGGYKTSKGEEIPVDNKLYAVAKLNYTFDELSEIVKEFWTQNLENATDELSKKSATEGLSFLNDNKWSYSIEANFTYYTEEEIANDPKLQGCQNGFKNSYYVKEMKVKALTLTTYPRYKDIGTVIENSGYNNNSNQKNNLLDNKNLTDQIKNLTNKNIENSMNENMNEDSIVKKILDALKPYFASEKAQASGDDTSKEEEVKATADNSTEEEKEDSKKTEANGDNELLARIEAIEQKLNEMQTKATKDNESLDMGLNASGFNQKTANTRELTARNYAKEEIANLANASWDNESK